MTKLMQTARLTQIARMDTIKGRVIVYTQPLDTAAFRIAAAKRWSPPSTSSPTVRFNSLAKDSPTTTTTSGILRGRRGTCLRLVHLGGLQE